MVQVNPALAVFLARRCAATATLAPGVATPARFSGAAAEHLATRRAAGLFDFSFMYCVEIEGAGSRDFLRVLQTRAVDRLAHGRIAYTLLLRDDGSVLIDATLWRLDDHRYWLFTGRRADAAYVAATARGYAVTLQDRSALQAVIAVQGPASTALIERVFSGQNPRALPYFGFMQLEFAGAECWLARIGYSGEHGYELIVADAVAPALWEALRTKDSGVLECGFEAADSLRIEAGHILFTRELAAAATPAELGLMRLIDFQRPEFRGAAALIAQRWRVPARRLVGMLPLNRARLDTGGPGAARRDQAVLTSRAWSPLLERELAMGLVPRGDAVPGALVTLANGERARVARLPFYDPARILPRQQA